MHREDRIAIIALSTAAVVGVAAGLFIGISSSSLILGIIVAIVPLAITAEVLGKWRNGV